MVRTRGYKWSEKGWHGYKTWTIHLALLIHYKYRSPNYTPGFKTPAKVGPQEYDNWCGNTFYRRQPWLRWAISTKDYSRPSYKRATNLPFPRLQTVSHQTWNHQRATLVTNARQGFQQDKPAKHINGANIKQYHWKDDCLQALPALRVGRTSGPWLEHNNTSAGRGFNLTHAFINYFWPWNRATSRHSRNYQLISKGSNICQQSNEKIQFHSHRDGNSRWKRNGENYNETGNQQDYRTPLTSRYTWLYGNRWTKLQKVGSWLPFLEKNLQTGLWLDCLQGHVYGGICTEPEAAWAFSRWATLHVDLHFDNQDDVRAIQTLEAGTEELQQEMGVQELLQRKFRLVHKSPPAIPNIPTIGPGHRGHRSNRDGIPRRTFATTTPILCQLQQHRLLNRPSRMAMPVIYDEMAKEYYVLVCHFFSGRRREQDCHWHLERQTLRFHKPIKFLILSLDTAVCEKNGNLDQGSNWNRIVMLLELMLIAFGLSGPPCETYSAARHLPPPTEESLRWPRPLRAPETLWGLRMLRCREIRQLAMGSRLLLHSLTMETMVNLGGGSSLMEHPSDRADQGIPAAWRAEAMTGLLRHLVGYQPNLIEQWRYGSKGVKPTCLRTIGCHQVRSTLRQYELPGLKRPKTRLEGLTDGGQWKTAEAKEYPPRALAAVVTTTGQNRLQFRDYRVVTWNSIPDEFQKWLKDVQIASSQITTKNWKPDYQGWLPCKCMRARDHSYADEWKKFYQEGFFEYPFLTHSHLTIGLEKKHLLATVIPFLLCQDQMKRLRFWSGQTREYDLCVSTPVEAACGGVQEKNRGVKNVFRECVMSTSD